MPYPHFKINAINPIFTMITSNCYKVKLDIKDTHHSIPILEKHQKYLKFLFGGKLYINSLALLMTCVLDREGLQNS